MRIAALQNGDYDCYREIFDEYQHALYQRLYDNLGELLCYFGLSPKQFQDDLEFQFPVEQTDYTYIENRTEWLEAQIPEFLTIELAKDLHKRTIQMQEKLLKSESQRRNHQLVLDNGGLYVRRLALDIVLQQVNITEAQFKAAMVTVDDVETVNEVQSVYSTEMRNNEDMRSHQRIMDSGPGRPASTSNQSRPAVENFQHIDHNVYNQHPADESDSLLKDQTILRSERKESANESGELALGLEVHTAMAEENKSPEPSRKAFEFSSNQQDRGGTSLKTGSSKRSGRVVRGVTVPALDFEMLGL